MSRKAEARRGSSAQQRTSRYRERMREAGFRPLQIWVPDTKDPSFARVLRRQLGRLRGKPEERGAFDLIESIGDLDR